MELKKILRINTIEKLPAGLAFEIGKRLLI